MNDVVRRWRTAIVLKGLWLAHVYPFNWAHKPLCERFRRDVIRVGHVHLCRSCFLVYASIAITLALAAWNPVWLQAGAVWIFTALGTTTIAFSMPHWYKRWPRVMRDVLRYSMGATMVLCGYVLATGHFVAGIAGTVALITFWRFYLALRRGRRLASCDGCLELGSHGICSGYRWQAQCTRAYEEKATAWLLGHETGCPVGTGAESAPSDGHEKSPVSI